MFHEYRSINNLISIKSSQQYAIASIPHIIYLLEVQKIEAFAARNRKHLIEECSSRRLGRGLWPRHQFEGPEQNFTEIFNVDEVESQSGRGMRI